MKGDSENVGEMEDMPIETYQSLQRLHISLQREMWAAVVGDAKEFQRLNGNSDGGLVWRTWDDAIMEQGSW